MAHHVIYVPGLGDHRSYGQPLVIQLWRIFGLRPHYFPLLWRSDEAFDLKLQRLIDKIDALSKNGSSVSLVGASAGASAVINAYAARPDVSGVVCICGKIQNPDKVDESYFIANPPFKKSIYNVKASLESLGPKGIARIMSIHPLYDTVVPVSETIIPGAVEKEFKTRGHAFTIFYSLIFGSRVIAQFIK
jgi:dienelactone hydrolase